jgi:transcriptional regulator with XRE-family HTH domain
MENNFISRSLMWSFKNLLSEERKKRKLTQVGLAERSGLTRQTISLFESGKRVPTLYSLFYLSRGLNISAAKFLSMLIKKLEFYERNERS